MQKEEIPTFLNEQPKVIFGRTGRELLIIVCGIVGGYSLWGSIHGLFLDAWWNAASIIIAIIPPILAFIVALFPVADRPLEEWAMCWFLYITMPRVYIYKSLESDTEEQDKGVETSKAQKELPVEDEDLLE